MELSSTTYPTDLNDEQWRFIGLLIPPSRPVGADRSTSTRAVVNAILYRERSGCSWRMLPHDFPHWRTVYGYYCQWKAEGVWQRICRARREAAECDSDSRNAAIAS
jgi:putative transposase